MRYWQDIYTQLFDNKFNYDEGYWGSKDNYYDQNWAWFATALYSDNLPNLWQSYEQTIVRSELSFPEIRESKVKFLIEKLELNQVGRSFVMDLLKGKLNKNYPISSDR